MTTTEIQHLIETHIPNGKAIIQSDDGRHFDAIVISDIFQGKTRVQQQQLVYAVLQQHILAGNIHAFSLKTFTPETWQNTPNTLLPSA